MAIAGFATGVWNSEAEGVKLLDKATAEWKKSDKLRNDFKTESFGSLACRARRGRARS